MAKKQEIGYKPVETAYTRDIDTWFIVLLLVLFFPLGLWLMWTRTSWKKVTKIIVTILIVILFINNGVRVAGNIRDAENAETNTSTPTVEDTV